MRRYDPLAAVARSDGGDRTIAAIAHALCVQFLAESDEKEDAKAMLASMPDELPPARRRRLILTLARHGIDPKLVPLTSLDEVAPRDLPHEFSSRGETRLARGWLDLYDRLRVQFLLDPLAQPAFETEVTGLTGFARAVVQGIGALAGLWHDRVTALPPRDALARLRNVLVNLDSGPGGFDDYSSRAAYQEFSPRLFDEVWRCAAWVLSPDDLRVLAEEWLASRAPSRFVRDVTSNLATLLCERDPVFFRAPVGTALDLMEARVNDDEETTVLVAAALACCAALGRCGHGDRAMRLWQRVFGLACGVSWRKDYQLNEIFAALPLVHVKSPGQTRARLARLLWMAHQLAGAAQRKTVAVAIHELAEVASTLIHPCLGLELLSREDEHVFRDWGLHRLVSRWVSESSLDLRFVWMVVRTMDRWENHSTYDDHTYPAMLEVFRAALARREQVLATEIYATARRLFLVEKDTPARVAEWASLFIASGLPPPAGMAEDVTTFTPSRLEEPTGAMPAAPTQLTAENGSATGEEGFDPNALFQRAQSDFSGFEAEISAHRVRLSVREQMRAVHQLMDQLDRLASTLTNDDPSHSEPATVGPPAPAAAMPATAPAQAPSDPAASIKAGGSETAGEAAPSQVPAAAQQSLPEELIAKLREMATHQVVDRTAARAVADLVIAQFAAASGHGELREIAHRSLELERWVDQLVSSATNRYDLEERLLVPHLPRWIEQARRDVLEDWERFCRTQLEGRARRVGLLAIAKRWQRLDPGRSMTLLREGWAGDQRFFFLASDEAGAILELAFRLDPAQGQKLLLEAFQAHLRRYPGNAIHHVDHLLKYAGHFAHDAERVYELLAQYGEHLVEGLAPRPVDTDWLINWAPPGSQRAAVIGYLLGLLDHPEVDLRRLAMKVLYDEAVGDPATLTSLVERGDSLGANAVEHVVTVLHAMALAHPALLAPHLGALARWLDVHHLATRQGVRELLLAAEAGDLQLEEALRGRLRSGFRPLVILRGSPLAASVRTALPPTISPYQTSVMRRAARAAPQGAFAQAVRARLGTKFQDERHGVRGDVEVYNDHHINDNFDRIEVEGPYERALQEAMNQALLDLINEHRLDENAVAEILPMLRKYDPTDLLVVRARRPDYVDWLPSNTEDADAFLSFADQSEVECRLLSRPREWATLYEHVEQRSPPSTGSESNRRVMARLVAFAIPAGTAVTPEALRAVLERPASISENLYRFEVCRAEGGTDPSIVPLVHITQRHFRGRNGLDVADVPREAARNIGIASPAWPWPLRPSVGEPTLRPTEWQEAFAQDRRRHEPVSEGFLLEIRGDVIREWLQRMGYEVVYLISQRRSVGKYNPESEMEWRPREWIVRTSPGK